MKKVLLAGLAAGMLATAAPMTQVAQAHPDYHYRGGCSFTTINDTTPGEPLGGQNQWTGEAAAYVIATTADGSETDPNTSTPEPTVAISFKCTLWRNGTVNLGTILEGSGTGAAADSIPSADQPTPFVFTAGATDTIQVCEEVTVGGNVHGDADSFNAASCEDSERTPIVPEPVTEILETLDPAICAVLAQLAPLVNDNVDPNVLRIDEDAPADGGADVWVLNTEFWLCPDYDK